MDNIGDGEYKIISTDFRLNGKFLLLVLLNKLIAYISKKALSGELQSDFEITIMCSFKCAQQISPSLTQKQTCYKTYRFRCIHVYEWM